MDETLRLWLDLVRYAGVRTPELTTRNGIENWARPNSPHPSRKNRPLLAKIFDAMQDGSIHHFGEEELEISGKMVKLSSIREFHALSSKFQTTGYDSRSKRVFSWISSFRKPLAETLQKELSGNRLDKFVEAIFEYLEADEELYRKASNTLEKYNTERSKIEKVRYILNDASIPDSKERLQYIDSFLEEALAPMAEMIHGIEKTRYELNIKYRGMTADMLMSSSGMKLIEVEMPSLDGLSDSLEDLPVLGEGVNSFENPNYSASVQVAKKEFDKFVNQVNEKYDIAVDVNRSHINSDVKSNTFQVQIVNVHGGDPKILQSNIETNIRE